MSDYDSLDSNATKEWAQNKKRKYEADPHVTLNLPFGTESDQFGHITHHQAAENSTWSSVKGQYYILEVLGNNRDLKWTHCYPCGEDFKNTCIIFS